ncbi:MAG: hypothetical protein V1913_17650 [Fibrobacterota bacterium]
MKRILIGMMTGALAAGLFAMDLSFVRDRSLETGVYAKTVRVGHSRATLFALPTVYSCALPNGLAFDAATVPVLGLSDLETSGIARLSNTKARLSWLYHDFLIATFGLRLPTGFNQFTSSQLITAGNIASRQLLFQNANLFSSLDLSASLASSLAFRDIGDGDLSLGLGLAYLYKGAVTPVEDSKLSFDPADEFSISLATEYDFRAYERKCQTLLDLGFTLYGSDQQQDAKALAIGNKFNWAFSGGVELAENLPLTVRVANFIKGANTHKLYGETSKKSSDLIASVTSGLPFARPQRPYAKLTLASYSGGGLQGYGDAFVTSLALGAAFRLSERLSLQNEISVDLGSLEGSGLLGLSGNAAFRYQF